MSDRRPRVPFRPRVLAAPAARFALTPAIVLALALLALGAAMLLVPPVACAHGDGSYPKIFNVDWTNNPNAALNSRYDMVALSSRATPAKFDSIKALNPSSIRLVTPAWYAYYNAGPSEYPSTSGPWAADHPDYGWDRRYWDLLEDNQFWAWGVDSTGARVHATAYWGMWLGNFSSKCPPNAQGKRLCDVFADMVIDDLIASKGDVDGVFFDQLWGSPAWLHWSMGGCKPGTNCAEQTPGTNWQAGFDLDEDGVADPMDSLGVWWGEGINVVFARFRERLGADFVILGNGDNRFTDANGAFNERFPLIHGEQDPQPNLWGFRWYDAMYGLSGYISVWPTLYRAPVRSILDTELASADRYTFPSGSLHQSLFRMTLGSALLGDGYYSLNNGTYGCYYWQPEYDLRLGWPRGPAAEVVVGGQSVWKREFTNGVVWVNPYYYPVGEGVSNPAIPAYDAVIQQGGGGFDPGTSPLSAIALAAPHPNPSVGGSATLNFALAAGEPGDLVVVDLRGRRVRSLWSGAGSGGAQSVLWDGRDDRGALVPTGVYFARLAGQAGRTAQQKLVRAR